MARAYRSSRSRSSYDDDLNEGASSSPRSSFNSGRGLGSEHDLAPRHDTPTAPRPTRAEYAAYAAMVRDLAEAEEGILARQLLQSRSQSRDQPRLQAQSERVRLNQAVSGVAPVDPIDGSATTRVDDTDPQKTTTNHLLTTAWPLQVEDLPGRHTSLEDSVLAFATAFIRENDLVHPASSKIPRTHGQEGLKALAIEQAMEEMMPDLVGSTTRFVEKNLQVLGGMRPAAARKQRAEMGKMSWRSVLATTALDVGQAKYVILVAKSNIRLRKLYKISGDDLLSHRMRIISDANAHRTVEPGLSSILYAGIPKPKPSSFRPHQSKQERAEREKKRLAKLERKANRGSSTKVT